jgi:hypothetical protein
MKNSIFGIFYATAAVLGPSFSPKEGGGVGLNKLSQPLLFLVPTV